MIEIEDDMEDWAKKCLTCIHCYTRKADADELYCRCRKGCNYETEKKKQKKK